MPFTTREAPVNWYPGTTKQATEDGYEVVTEASPFAKNQQSPERNGFRGKECVPDWVSCDYEPTEGEVSDD